jgi:hypothetical protein
VKSLFNKTNLPPLTLCVAAYINRGTEAPTNVSLKTTPPAVVSAMHGQNWLTDRFEERQRYLRGHSYPNVIYVGRSTKIHQFPSQFKLIIPL